MDTSEVRREQPRAYHELFIGADAHRRLRDQELRRETVSSRAP